MDALTEVIERGSYSDLLRAIGGLNERQRKSAAVWLVGQWRQHRGAPHPKDALEPLARWMRLLVGLTAAAAEPRKALAIPPRHGGWDARVAWATGWPLPPVAAEALAALAEAAIGHGADWCAQYLSLVLDARKPKPMFVEVVLLIARAHGLSLPATPIAGEMWAASFASLVPRRFAHQLLPYKRTVYRLELHRHEAGISVSGHALEVTSPAESLRGDLDLEPMLLSLFDHRDAVIRLAGMYSGQQEMDDVAAFVAELVGNGSVDAARLARQAIAALSRGDSVACQRLQTRLLKVANADTALVHEQSRVLAGLLASGTVTTAALALELLRDADTPLSLPDDLFTEACEIVFGRKDKGLREAMLAWARARIERPESRANAASGLTSALRCPDHSVQQQAVSLLESAWSALEGASRAALLASIEASQDVLDAALYRQLWAACTGGAATPDAAAQPPRVELLRTGLPRAPYVAVPDPAQLPADVLQAAQTYRLDRDPLAYERLIGCAQDALRSGQRALARAISRHLRLERPSASSLRAPGPPSPELSYVAWARIDELLAAIQRGQPQTFVSTPSWTHGAIAGEHLVDRLAAMAGSGETALPVDLLVSLLRTEPCDAATLERLRAIGSAQAQVAADFLTAGGSGQLATRWHVIEGGADAPLGRSSHAWACWALKGERAVCVSLGAVVHPPAIRGAPLDWAAGFEPLFAPFVSEFDMAADWITSMLPNNAEALAALHLYGFRRAGLEYDTDGGKAVAIRLPMFTAAHGSAGPAMHLATLFAMSANDAPARLAGSDGMVALLQQGRWQAPLAAELVAECLRSGSVKPGRLASSLEPVLQAGEGAAVWSLLRAAIAAALRMQPVPTATADLVARGVQALQAAGTAAPVEGLDAFVAAIKGKPNKLQAQAVRLHAALVNCR